MHYFDMKRYWRTANILCVVLYWAAGADCLANTAATTRRCSRSSDAIDRMRRPPRLECRSDESMRRRSELRMASSDPSREDEIRRKILDLKQEGKLQPKTTRRPQSSRTTPPPPSDAPLDAMRESIESRSADEYAETLDEMRESIKSRSVDEYAEKLGSKLGGRRGRQVGRMLDLDVPVTSPQAAAEDEARKPRLGALDGEDSEDYDEDEDEDDGFDEVVSEEERRERAEITSAAASDAIEMLRKNVDKGKDEDSDEMDEEEMLDAVAKALARTGGFQSTRGRGLSSAEDNIATVPATPPGTDVPKSSVPSSTASTGKTTSGIGGSWAPPSQPATGEEAYQPKVGTWGAFPRPKNISVAYGGGKRVGAGVETDASKKQQSIDSTKDRLRAYREKMGIDVQSEKDNADDIDQALEIASRAMQRGAYSTGVSALEKVTRYCSTKSKVGGKVFLELAMAYEAEGRTDEAIGLYAALSRSPIERVKANADKLLYGLEAMNFMRNEAKLKEFQRKTAADTFIDATGFNDITKNFDKVYNTAYINLDKGGQYYRMLTENVVRSTREARQILLKAVSKGVVDRMKVVQALRSISRNFDEALDAEKKDEERQNVPVDYAGRPIVSTPRRSSEEDLAKAIGMDGFVLSDPSQMLTNLDGEWRLQLMADKKGDGVEFFNSTLLWQAIDSSEMGYSSGSKGLRSSSQLGDLSFDGKDRILSREAGSEKSGGAGGFFSMLLGGGGGTAGEMTRVPQQILSADSALLVTRAIVKAQAADNVKDYFSVWRRVEPGTYTKSKT